ASEAAEQTALRRSLKLLPSDIVHVFPVGSNETANVAVTSLQVADGLHLAGKPTALRVSLQRFGNGNATQSVEFRVDDRLQETRSVTVPQGNEATIDWLPMLSTGEHRLEVRIDEDSLLADNRRFAAVTVRDRLPILLENGKPSGEPWENATDLLK